MNSTRSFLRFSVLFAGLFAFGAWFGSGSLSPIVAQSNSKTAEPLRYVQVSKATTVARNIADTRGKSVGSFEKGTPLAVFREEARFLAVEAPGGFKAWVHGRFLRQTATADVREVTGNGVNIRPGPKADVQNFPLGTALFAGDQVRVLQKNDPALADQDAWFQILTPPGVTAYVAKSDVAPYKTVSAARTAWKTAVAAAVPVVEAQPVTETKPEGAGSSETQAANAPVGTGKPAEASVQVDPRKVLEQARRMLDRENRATTPDFGKVLAEFKKAQRLAGGGTVAVEAAVEIERVNALIEKEQLKGQLEAERRRVVAEAARRQEEAARLAQKTDPLSVLFHARGVLERRIELDGTPRYVLLSGGIPAFELTSGGGRYDLDMYLGYRIGVRGVRKTLLGAEVIGIDALEVIARR